jgi:hypothetical protein
VIELTKLRVINAYMVCWKRFWFCSSNKGALFIIWWDCCDARFLYHIELFILVRLHIVSFRWHIVNLAGKSRLQGGKKKDMGGQQNLPRKAVLVYNNIPRPPAGLKILEPFKNSEMAESDYFFWNSANLTKFNWFFPDFQNSDRTESAGFLLNFYKIQQILC